MSAVLFYLLNNLRSILARSIYHELVPVETKKKKLDEMKEVI